MTLKFENKLFIKNLRLLLHELNQKLEKKL